MFLLHPSHYTLKYLKFKIKSLEESRLKQSLAFIGVIKRSGFSIKPLSYATIKNIASKLNPIGSILVFQTKKLCKAAGIVENPVQV